MIYVNKSYTWYDLCKYKTVNVIKVHSVINGGEIHWTVVLCVENQGWGLVKWKFTSSNCAIFKRKSQEQYDTMLADLALGELGLWMSVSLFLVFSPTPNSLWELKKKNAMWVPQKCENHLAKFNILLWQTDEYSDRKRHFKEACGQLFLIGKYQKYSQQNQR